MFKGFGAKTADIVVKYRLSTGNHFLNSKYDNIEYLIFCFKIGVT